MYAFLLILGAVIAVAGVLIAAPGLPILGHEFDPSIITPGAISVVGGLILVGFALALRALSRLEQVGVRTLWRIEQLLEGRPLPPAAVSEEASSVAAAAEPVSAPPAPISLPPEPEEVRPQPAPAATATALPEDAALERLREQFPTLVRLETSTVVEEADISLLPKPPVRAVEEAAEPNAAVAPANGRANGAAPARAEPRLELHVRPTPRVERSRNFDAYWPKKQRADRAAPAAAAVQPAPTAPPPPPLTVVPALPAEPTQFQFREPAPEPAAAVEANGSAQVSVLKSGVVDGMAYTLYSDGSIEAQLPQGTLRFGSIAELRNHIEQSA